MSTRIKGWGLWGFDHGSQELETQDSGKGSMLLSRKVLRLAGTYTAVSSKSHSLSPFCAWTLQQSHGVKSPREQ